MGMGLQGNSLKAVPAAFLVKMALTMFGTSHKLTKSFPKLRVILLHEKRT